MQTGIVNNPLYLVCGHYGAGKTNLSLNLVRDSRASYERMTLIDLDIVNPYFRSTDYRQFVEDLDVMLLGPVYGGSNLDTPSLSPGIDTAIREADNGYAVIIDVGGDPDGARALARFADSFLQRERQPQYELAFVCNFRRPGTASVEDNLELIAQIEQTSKLRVTQIIGNTHLKASTSVDVVAQAAAPTLELANSLGVPLVAITAPRALEADVRAKLALAPQTASLPVTPIDIIVGTSWELADSLGV